MSAFFVRGRDEPTVRGGCRGEKWRTASYRRHHPTVRALLLADRASGTILHKVLYRGPVPVELACARRARAP
jgi:hypothetical protein